MMNHRLSHYISQKLNDAAEYVNTHMPVNAETDAIYEGIVGEPHVCEAFRNAGQYLPPATLSGSVRVEYMGRVLQLRLHLSPTDRYPSFLLPKYDFRINSESEFGKALALPLRVATEWEMLRTVWSRFERNVDNINALGIIFPWLSPLLVGVELDDISDGFIRTKTEREEVRRQIAAIHSGNVPKILPSLTTWISTVCKSGKALLSQYRMIEAAVKVDTRVTPRVQITNMPALISPRFHQELEEVVEEWVAKQADAFALHVAKRKRNRKIKR